VLRLLQHQQQKVTFYVDRFLDLAGFWKGLNLLIPQLAANNKIIILTAITVTKMMMMNIIIIIIIISPLCTEQ
jgi:hypothetical protein